MSPTTTFPRDQTSRPRRLASLLRPDDVREMFDRLVGGYDRFNFLSSLSLDQQWRKTMVKSIASGSIVLDVGTGTGDTALIAATKAKQVIGIDFSRAMIQKAKEKAKDFPMVQFQVGEANHLPFQPAAFNAVTSSFVLRNLYRINALDSFYQESFRVLKDGGLSLSLELTRPSNKLVRWGHAVYLKTILPLIGKSLFGRQWPSGYLRESIQEFPEPGWILELLSSMGFRSVMYHPLHGGLAGIFSAVKESNNAATVR